MGFFLLSTVAGVLLWLNTRAGFMTTAVVLLLQLPKFYSPQLVYMVNAGFDVTAMMVTHAGPPPVSGVRVHFQIGSHYLLHADPAQGGVRGIGVSLWSCVGLWLLARRGRALAPAAPPEPTDPAVTLPRYPSS
jgi:hypothetical protein